MQLLQVTGDINADYFEQLKSTRTDAALAIGRSAALDVSCFCFPPLYIAGFSPDLIHLVD